jgi:hypothetical protein
MEEAEQGRSISFERLAQLVDRAEEQGGFRVCNYNVEVDDEVLGLVDTIRFREMMMDRQSQREQDKSTDYKAAQSQGYRAAVNDMRLALDTLGSR